MYVRSRDDGARLNVQIELLQQLTASRSYKGYLPEYAVRVEQRKQSEKRVMDGCHSIKLTVAYPNSDRLMSNERTEIT
jgi:hypothetical protein